MTFNTRPALREQWLLIILAIALFLLPFLPWLETNASLGTLKITALLEAPFLIVCLIIIGRHDLWLNKYLFAFKGRIFGFLFIFVGA